MTCLASCRNEVSPCARAGVHPVSERKGMSGGGVRSRQSIPGKSRLQLRSLCPGATPQPVPLSRPPPERERESERQETARLLGTDRSEGLGSLILWILQLNASGQRFERF